MEGRKVERKAGRMAGRTAEKMEERKVGKMVESTEGLQMVKLQKGLTQPHSLLQL